MTIQAQIDLIKKNQRIEDVGDIVAQQVFRKVCHTFRKWLSPVRQPANAWLENVDKMKLLCRLPHDNLVDVELLAVRAAAQIEAVLQPGKLDDLVKAAGLDVSASAKSSVGETEADRIAILRADTNPNLKGSFSITLGDWIIRIRDVDIETNVFAANREDAAKAIDRIAKRNTGGSRQIEIAYEEAPVYQGEMFDTVHDPWRPTRVYSEQLKAHPTQIIEPATLAATPYPKPTYRPVLPAEAVTRGLISDAQFETILYALQATEEYLPGAPSGSPYDRAPRAGFVIGDGTGVGKTNEACGIILDQWSRGSKRHIFIVEREKHYEHIREAWESLGGKPRDIIWHGDYAPKEPLPDRDAVLVSSYALIRNDERYNAILDWALSHGKFEGCLIFDEAHNLRNAIEDRYDEGSGRRAQSQQGKRGLEIQTALIDARVIYMSATMATDVYNLGYAPRLGIWGVNAPFPTIDAFIAEMQELDDGALEQICIDLKAAGRYCSRNLSFDGVEYDEIVHRLTPEQRAMFDNLVRNWIELDKLYNAASNLCIAKRPTKPRGTWRMRRLSIEQLLANFNTDSLIEDMHAELAAGNAPVVQIAFTGEARLKRIANGRNFIPEEDYVDKTVISWVEEQFPDHKGIWDPALGDYRPVLDDAGNKITVPAAAALKQKAMDLAIKMSPRHSPLDKLYLAFGKDMIAEMTGRSVRALPVMKNGKLKGWDINERAGSAAVDDVKAFERGTKRILVFSLGAGGTGLSYHASRDIINKARRIHYIHELGQRAEQSVQGLGRTHRSGQITAPIVKIVRSDVPAHAIFASRTLNKIAKMGALSRGHQHAATNAIFDQRIPLQDIYAQRGWTRTLEEVAEGKLGILTLDILSNDLGLPIRGENKESLANLESALMKLATLTHGDQRLLIERLIHNTEEAIASAIRSGAYNQGLETIRASSIEIVDDNRIENANGSETIYYRLRKKEKIDQLPFRRAAMTAAAARSKKGSRAVFMRHKVNGRIMLGVMRDGPAGIVDVFTPAGVSTRTREMLRQEPWKLIDDILEAERLWNLESEKLDIRGVSDVHILSGSLLYNWNKLPKTGAALSRCRTDDGKVIVGRIIHQRDLRDTLQRLGMKSNYRPAQIAAFLTKVSQGAELEIDNGWILSAPQTSGGDYQLLIPSAEQTGTLRAELQSMGIRIVDTPLGYDLEIPRADAIAIIQAVAIGSEINLKGTTMQHGTQTSVSTHAMPVAMAACK